MPRKDWSLTWRMGEYRHQGFYAFHSRQCNRRCKLELAKSFRTKTQACSCNEGFLQKFRVLICRLKDYTSSRVMGMLIFKTDGLNLTSVHPEPPIESEVQLKAADRELVYNGDMKNFPPSAVGRFNSRCNRLNFRSPGLEVHHRPMTACCNAKCGSYGSSRIVLKRNKPLRNMTCLVQVLSKQLSSALHVSLKTSQIRNLVGVEFVVSDWFASSSKILPREDVDQGTFLAAFKMSGTDVLIAEGDVRIWWQLSIFMPMGYTI